MFQYNKVRFLVLDLFEDGSICYALSRYGKILNPICTVPYHMKLELNDISAHLPYSVKRLRFWRSFSWMLWNRLYTVTLNKIRMTSTYNHKCVSTFLRSRSRPHLCMCRVQSLKAGKLKIFPSLNLASKISDPPSISLYRRWCAHCRAQWRTTRRCVGGW